MNENENAPKRRKWLLIATVIVMILLVASCIAVQKTNVITPTIVLQIGSGISFQNGEDLPEVTVGGMDSVNNEPVRIGNQAPATKQQGVKVVYHLSGGVEEASYGLENIRNHLLADPSVKIVVVVNGKGIELMLNGAKGADGKPFAISINDLKSTGVEFRVCEDTLNRRNIDKAQVISEASIIPSGVAEIARLQFKEGYAYLRP